MTKMKRWKSLGPKLLKLEWYAKEQNPGENLTGFLTTELALMIKNKVPRQHVFKKA